MEIKENGNLDILEFSDLTIFEQTKMIADHLNLSSLDIADILEEEFVNIEKMIPVGLHPSFFSEKPENLYIKLCTLHSLFGYFLSLSHHNIHELSELWGEVSSFDDIKNKPPWFEIGLNDFLFKEKYSGLQECLIWAKGGYKND